MKAKIDANICTGCEFCIGVCPDVFELDGDTVKIKKQPADESVEETCREARDGCPVEAITIEE